MTNGKLERSWHAYRFVTTRHSCSITRRCCLLSIVLNVLYWTFYDLLIRNIVIRDNQEAEKQYTVT